MKSGYFIRALFKPHNFLLLVLTLILLGVTGAGVVLAGLTLPYLSAGALAVLSAAGVLASTARTTKDTRFLLECRQAERLDDLQKLSWDCNDLYNSVSKKVDRNIRLKMKSILKQKEELIRYFRDYREDPVKQTIVEQALKLVIAYYNLAFTYFVRRTEYSAQNIRAIEQRINYNNRRLGALKSYGAVLELTKTIEVDEKLLQSIRNETQELEKINVRLNYIESTINAFKHRIISVDSSDPEVEEIESIISEATALDNVLNERKKARL